MEANGRVCERYAAHSGKLRRMLQGAESAAGREVAARAPDAPAD